MHLSLRVPADLEDDVVTLLCDDPATTNVAVVAGGYTKPKGTRVEVDVAREGADRLLGRLRKLDLHHVGSITVAEQETVFSDAAKEVEEQAPGLPEDSLVWDLLEDRVRTQSRFSFAFVAFLTLATLIAGAGRLLDQPILIIGAMVVGPEFSPLAAISVGLARPRPSLLPPALVSLWAGFTIAVLIAVPLWFAGYRLGAFTQAAAAHGNRTDFIVQPNWWSLAIALLAGVAGTLSLTTVKSSALVGVFISVTTVPAVGTIALCLGTGVWSEVLPALAQLLINLAGIVAAGTLTLLTMKLVWRSVPTTRRPDTRRKPL
jgi:uncharacterized hydrophobic protein (TIGR00271 family)